MTWHEATTGEGALGVDETDPSREQGAGSRESAPDGGSFKYGYHGEVSPYGTAPSTPIESTSGSFKQEGFASARPPRGSPLSSPAQSPAQSPLNSPIMQRRRLWPQGRGGAGAHGPFTAGAHGPFTAGEASTPTPLRRSRAAQGWGGGPKATDVLARIAAEVGSGEVVQFRRAGLAAEVPASDRTHMHAARQ